MPRYLYALVVLCFFSVANAQVSDLFQHRIGIHLGHSHGFFWDQKVMTGPNLRAISAFDVDYTYKNKFYYSFGIRAHRVSTPFAMGSNEEFVSRDYSQVQSRFGYNIISENTRFRLIPFVEAIWRYGRDEVFSNGIGIEPGVIRRQIYREADQYNSPGFGFGLLGQMSLKRFDFTLSVAQEYFADSYSYFYLYEITSFNRFYPQRTYPQNKQQFTISLTAGYHFDF